MPKRYAKNAGGRMLQTQGLKIISVVLRKMDTNHYITRLKLGGKEKHGL
jgi:hypothetical protein